MNIKNFIIPAIACFCCSSFFISCEEKGLMVNDNDVSYIIFAKDMTKDTTTVSFKVYNEGEVPEIPLEVSVYGKVQDKDLKFSVSVDEDRTTLPANLYELPTECLIEKGQLTGSVCIKLKNSEILSTNTLILALKIDEKEEVRNALMDELCTFENGYLAERGGILYPQLAETLYTLSMKYPLYIVSNCQDGYIESFLTAHLMSDFFKDTECWGRTFLSKGESNKILMERNGLKNPVYVGDTAGDAKSAKDAGIDFIYAEYGFGDVSKDCYVAKIESFAELAEIL